MIVYELDNMMLEDSLILFIMVKALQNPASSLKSPHNIGVLQRHRNHKAITYPSHLSGRLLREKGLKALLLYVLAFSPSRQTSSLTSAMHTSSNENSSTACTKSVMKQISKCELILSRFAEDSTFRESPHRESALCTISHMIVYL
jgi:hypothetical protein